eukprot:m.125206 g.125206  ORF g.125206 m.125206 type:complete len:1588 (+) comp12976_c0_seq1:134-4897(+)
MRNPPTFMRFFFAAVCHTKLKNYLKAEEKYTDAIAANPTQPAAYQGLSDLYENNRNVFPSDPQPKLKGLYQNILEIQGPNATVKGKSVLNNLIHLLQDDGDTDGVIEYTFKLLALDSIELQQKIEAFASCVVSVVDAHSNMLRRATTSITKRRFHATEMWRKLEEGDGKPSELIGFGLPILQSIDIKEHEDNVAQWLSLCSQLWQHGVIDISLAVNYILAFVREDVVLSERIVDLVLQLSRDIFAEDSVVDIIAEQSIHKIDDFFTRHHMQSPHQLREEYNGAKRNSKPASVKWDELQSKLIQCCDENNDIATVAVAAECCFNRDAYITALKYCISALSSCEEIEQVHHGRSILNMKVFFLSIRARIHARIDPKVIPSEISVLAKYQHNVFALIALVELHISQRKFDMAYLHLRNAEDICAGTHPMQELIHFVKSRLNYQVSLAEQTQQFPSASLAIAMDEIDAAIELSCGVSEYHFLRGMLLLQLRINEPQTRAALNEFLLCLKISDGHALAFCQVGHVYSNTNKKKAIKCFQKALSLDPGLDEAARTLWLLYIEINMKTEADALIRALAQKKGSESLVWVWMQKGMLHLESGDGGNAVISFQTALKRSSDDASVWLLLGEAYQLRGSYVSSLHALKNCLDLDPTQSHAKYLMGVSYLRLGEDADAVESFKAVLDHDKRHVPSIEGLVSALHAQALDNFRQRLPHQCFEAIASAMRVLSRHLRTHNTYISLWKLCGDVFQLALELPTALQGELIDAVTIFNIPHKPTELADDHPLPQEESQRFCELCASAAAAYKNVLDLTISRGDNQSNALYDIAVNRFKLFSATRQCSLLKEGVVLCKASISSNKENDSAWNLLGLFAYFMKDRKLAYNSFCKAIEVAPKNAHCWVNVGCLGLLEGGNNLLFANKAFSQAQLLDPGLSRAWIGQGIVAARFGYSDALDLFQHAHTLYPHHTSLLGFSYYTLSATTPNVPTPSLSEPVDTKAILDSVLTGRIPQGEENQFYMLGSIALADLATTCMGEHDAGVWNMRALFMEKLGMYDSACSALEKALAIIQKQKEEKKEKKKDKEDSHSDKQLETYLATIQANYARNLSSAGRLDESLEYFKAIPKLTDISTKSIYARTLFEKNEFHECFSVYDEIRSECNNPQIHAEATTCMAVVAFANDDMDVAKQLLFEAVSSPEECPAALLIMAALGLYANDMSLAEAALAECPPLWHDGKNDDELFVEEYLTLSHYAYILGGADSVAKSFLLQSVKLFSDRPRGWLMLVAVLLREKEPKSAEIASSALSRASKLDPSAAADRFSAVIELLHSQSCQFELSSGKQTKTNKRIKDGMVGKETTKNAIRTALRAVRAQPEDASNWAVLALSHLQSTNKSAVSNCRYCLLRCISILDSGISTCGDGTLNIARKYKSEILKRWCYLIWCESGVTLAQRSETEDDNINLDDEEIVCEEQLSLCNGDTTAVLAKELQVCKAAIVYFKAGVSAAVAVSTEHEEGSSFNGVVSLAIHFTSKGWFSQAFDVVSFGLESVSEQKVTEEEMVKLLGWKCFLARQLEKESVKKETVATANNIFQSNKALKKTFGKLFSSLST